MARIKEITIALNKSDIKFMVDNNARLFACKAGHEHKNISVNKLEWEFIKDSIDNLFISYEKETY